tara:strand:- start:465 stop:737 length:273 start_codon:yes stop_codon:yes gene_type:complete
MKWKNILKDDDLDPQVRLKLMDVYGNLHKELRIAVIDLAKHGHSLNSASDMLYELNANWEDLKPKEFGFGERGKEKFNNIEGVDNSSQKF